MSATLRDILNLLESHYPSAWAVPGDRVGLEVGHPRQAVEAILVALEVTPAVIAEAGRRGAQLLLTHHPLLYQPLKDVREDRPGGQVLAALIRAGLALVSCHTNLDIAPGGLNDYLAGRLGLTGLEVLSPTTRDPWYKLVVFVPVGYEDRVRRALGDAGLGVIGRYSHCSFASPGQGAYRPLPGAAPFQGEVGQLSRAVESRLEFLAPESLLPEALTLLKETHPYDEVAYDLYPLRHPGTPLGLGRVGVWPEPRPFSQVIAEVKEIFGLDTVQVWGHPPRQVQRLALCSGSGGDLLAAAAESGAQVYLTGEVRHHQAIPAYEGLAVVAVGHYVSEALFMEPWSRQLASLFQEAGLALNVMAAAGQAAPCNYV
ncbi:MAG: Nif3-like dinuclear metal center hexameric protein [Syntrophobacterales bacterium]|jgi:dinuclear metal center YbgI/SA1388 family protein|nr:Nif3-like dinuclear metal center hexameric protein [Syntrophobacterales bacterium]